MSQSLDPSILRQSIASRNSIDSNNYSSPGRCLGEYTVRDHIIRGITDFCIV